MYELMYLVRPSVDEQSLASVNDKVEKFISAGGGQVARRDDWGKRRMAYPVLKFTEAFYSVLQVEMPPTAIRDLERSLKLTEEILRYIVVRVDSD